MHVSSSAVRSRIGTLVVGIGVPVAIAAALLAAWAVSDALLWIGPLDRAAFGWAVLMPAWAVSPVVVGVAWQQLTTRGATFAAIGAGTTVAAAAGWLLWRAAAVPSCEFGPTRSPAELLLPSFLVGAAVGGTIAGSSLVAAHLWRRGLAGRAAVAGAAVQLLGTAAAVAVGTPLLLVQGACQRPPA